VVVRKYAARARRACAWFLGLTVGLTMGDTIALLNLSKSPMKRYHASNVIMDDAKNPWPVHWVSAARHRKFTRAFPRLPSTTILTDALDNFTNKLMWRHYHEKQRTLPVQQIARYPGAPTPRCTLFDNLPIAFLHNEMKFQAISQANRIHSRFSQRGSAYPNVTPIDALGLKILCHHSEEMLLVARDKGCGYILHSCYVLRSVHEAFLESSDYVEVSPTSLITRRAHVLLRSFFPEEYRANIVRQLTRSSCLPNNSQYATLQTTCKDHKSPVEHRILHSAPNFSFSGLSQFVRAFIAPHLKALPHIIPNAQSLAAELASISDPADAMLLRIDLKRFFLSGDATDLASTINTLGSSPSQRITLDDVLHFCLYHQHIRSPLFEDRSFRAIKGAGMGLKHSSDVANACL
jgi:hypothetical protein